MGMLFSTQRHRIVVVKFNFQFKLTDITFHLQHMLMSLLHFNQIVSRYLARQEWSLLLEPAGAHPLEGHDKPTVKGGHCLCGGRSCATCSGHMIDLNRSEVSTLWWPPWQRLGFIRGSPVQDTHEPHQDTLALKSRVLLVGWFSLLLSLNVCQWAVSFRFVMASHLAVVWWMLDVYYPCRFILLSVSHVCVECMLSMMYCNSFKSKIMASV